jgi:hypothetical protein
MCLFEAEMVQCENGHTICDEHLIDPPDNWENEDWGLDWRYEVPSQHCPLCHLEDITVDDMAHYLLKVAGLTREQLLSDIREKYGDYRKFWEFMRGGGKSEAAG